MNEKYIQSPKSLKLNYLLSSGEVSEKVIDVIETLTGQERLRKLSMAPLNGVFNQMGLFKSTKEWCPRCYKEHGKNIYEPLYWTINGVKSCVKHNVLLKNKCPQCKNTVPHISGFHRIGYCSHCYYRFASEEEVTYFREIEDVWVGNNVADLTRYSSLALGPITFNINYIFKRAVDLSGLRPAYFAKILGYPKSTIFYWYNNANKMSFQHLLRICYCL